MRPAVASALSRSLSLALVVPVLAACALLEGGDRLDDALDVVPADATSVEFVDRAALAERLDLEDADPEEYVEASFEDAGTTLARYLRPMSEGPLDERDVEWWAYGFVDDGLFEVFEVSGDVDLDAVADDLVDAGFDEDEVRGRRRVVGDLDLVGGDGLIGGVYPPTFLDVVVDPEEDLLVLGSGGEAVLETLDDDADSMTDADTFDDVLDGTDDVEYAALSADPPCDAGGRERMTPEQLGSVEDELDGIGTPEATAYLVSGGDAETSARIEFADGDAAEADLEARSDYLDKGLLLGNRVPFGDVGTAELERDGSVVAIALDLRSGGVGRDLALNGDGFLVCTEGQGQG